MCHIHALSKGTDTKFKGMVVHKTRHNKLLLFLTMECSVSDDCSQNLEATRSCEVGVKPLSHSERETDKVFLLSGDVRQYSFYVHSMFGIFVSCPVMCGLSASIRWKVLCMHKN